MARPKKAVVDYFPHYVNHGRTMYTIQSKYGNDGYAFWFKLLELLGSTEQHYINCNDIETWEYILATTKFDNQKAIEILDLFSKLGSIDSDLWQSKIIWSENFVNNLDCVYKRRDVKLYDKTDLIGLMSTLIPLNRVTVDINPQSKVKESKVKESNILSSNFCEIIDYLNLKANTKYRHTTKNTKELIQARFNDNFTLENFKTVIDKKCAEWIGTEFEKFLRPNTLFSTKFEGYLNQNIIKPKEKLSNRDNFEGRNYTQKEMDEIERKVTGN